MGTKIQCKTYIPDCFGMRDLNGSASNNWSSYYEDKTSNGSLYDGFIMQPINGHAEHGMVRMEMVKRMMLEHEATFRKQIYELHRLYRTQKDLMDDFTKKEFYRYCSSNSASQSSFGLSPIPFEANGPKWQLSHQNAGPVYAKYQMNFPANNSVDSKLKTLSKRTFDLRLPADAYVDPEDVERNEREDVAESPPGVALSLNIKFDRSSDKIFNLTLGHGEEDVCSRNISSISQNGTSFQFISDLNESVEEEEAFKGANVPPSAGVIGAKTQFEEFGDHLPKKLATTGTSWFKDFSQDIHTDKATLHTEEEKVKHQRPFLNSEAGSSRNGASILNRGLCNERFPVPYEAAHLMLSKTQDALLPHKNIGETLFSEETNYGVGFSGQKINFANSNSTNVDFSSAAASSLRNAFNGINRIPIATKAQSRDLYVGTQNSAHAGDFYFNSSETRLPSYGTESSYQNSFYHPTCTLEKADCDYTKYMKNLHTPDIKSAKNPDKFVHDVELGASGSVSWLKTRMTRNKSIHLGKNNSEMLLQPACKEIDLNYTVSSVTEGSEENNSSIFRNRINLNLDAQGDPSEILPDLEANHQQPIAKPSPFIIDLEIPANPMEDISSFQEMECSSEALAKGAAENIIALSKDQISSFLRYSSSPDSLDWFVDVVLTSEKQTENLLSCSGDEMSDSFENLTLKLEEIKPETYVIIDKGEDYAKDEEKHASSLLTRSRRGRARRRQRRDFQKDILPGLVTLSRNEITEDLQAFGGIMKITGRRNSGRKSRAAVTNNVDRKDSTEKVENNFELDNKTVEGGFMAWGRTRRCRRQRFPPGSVAPPLT